MKSMDDLLSGEMSHIESQRILENQAKANELAQNYFDRELEVSDEERKSYLTEVKKFSTQAQSELRPLFERLLHIGFDRGLLMR